jgi:hypothetical protein
LLLLVFSILGDLLSIRLLRLLHCHGRWHTILATRWLGNRIHSVIILSTPIPSLLLCHNDRIVFHNLLLFSIGLIRFFAFLSAKELVGAGPTGSSNGLLLFSVGLV